MRLSLRLPKILLLSTSMWLTASALAAPTVPPPDRLAGKRLADRLLLASDAQRGEIAPAALAMALRRHGVARAALRADFVRSHNDHYTKELPPTPIRAQAQSGRCWIFTALNVIERDAQLKSGRDKPIKLSRAYINAKNLQSVAYELIKTGAKATSLTMVADSDVGEGGNFGLALNMIDRFGAVPEHVMRDFHDSKNSAATLKLIETLVVDAQERLRRTGRDTPDAVKIVKEAQAAIDLAIARSFTGKDKLPDTFLFEGKEYTPKTFAALQLAVKPSDYITLEDARQARPGWRQWGSGAHFTETYNTGNVEFMKQAIRNAIDQGKKVYVSAPVNAASAPYMISAAGMPGLPNAKGVMSLGAYDYKSIGMPEPVTDRLKIQRNGLNPTNHAMTITGYDLGPDGKVIKWKVENSWGTSAADRGIQHMYDDFLGAFVGNITVPRTALPAAFINRINSEKKANNDIKWEPS